MNKENIIKELSYRGIQANENQVNRLFSFMDETLLMNEKFNLTAIKDKDVFVEKMIFDSAIAMQELDLSDKKVIDVGTGGGFPGIVLYILNPKMNLTLLDATKKKIDYLINYTKENHYVINCICSRIEEYGHQEHYDYAFARAVAPLNILLELIVPLLKIGGTFIALKGSGFVKEIEQSKTAMKKLNCHLVKIIEDELPESHEKRYMVYIQKDNSTNKKYPRRYAEIKKAPL